MKNEFSDKAQPSHEATMELLRIGGRTMRVATWRTNCKTPKRPILFFNGIGANIELMEPLADWFKDRDIITFDMPGVGRSPTPIFPYRPWMISRYACKLLDHHKLEVVDVMGVSWGGAMAQQFAFQHPRRTGKLILAATSAGMLMVPGDPEVLSKMASPKRYMDPNYMVENFRALYGGESTGSHDHASRLLPPSIPGYLHQLGCMLGWTSAWFLPFMRAKTLILMGNKDKIVPVVNGKILASLAPNAKLKIVEGGHLFLVSRAHEVAPIMREFLDESEPAPRTASARSNVRPKRTIAKAA